MQLCHWNSLAWWDRDQFSGRFKCPRSGRTIRGRVAVDSWGRHSRDEYRPPMKRLLLGQLGRSLLDVLDATAHEEGLLGHAVEVAVGKSLERHDGVLQRHGRAGDAGERHRRVGVLREEPLDPAGPANEDLVLFGQLVDTEDGDDVLQLLV